MIHMRREGWLRFDAWREHEIPEHVEENVKKRRGHLLLNEGREAEKIQGEGTYTRKDLAGAMSNTYKSLQMFSKGNAGEDKFSMYFFVNSSEGGGHISRS